MTVKEPQIGKIEALVLRMQLAKPQGAARPITFLMGAGCSVSAGIPTVTTIAQNEVLALAANFGATPHNPAEAIVALASHGLFAGHAEIARTKPDTLNWGFIYDAIFKEVHTAPTDVGKLFKRILQEANPRINWAHLALGGLAAKGWISTTITTNFDLLALEGYARAGVIPVVSDGVESLGRIDPRPDHPQLLQINGSMHAYRLRNSDDDLKELTKLPGAIACFQNLFQHSDVFVVVGYDGREPHIMKLLTDAAKAYPDKHIFWCLYSANAADLSSNARDFLSHSNNARLLIDQDADLFFHALCAGLGLGAPHALRDPLDFAQSRRAGIYDPKHLRHAPIRAELAAFDAEIVRLKRGPPPRDADPALPPSPPKPDPVKKPPRRRGGKAKPADEVEGEVTKILDKLKALHGDSGEALFDALRAEQDLWYERGRDKGLPFDLQVAIRLAEICRDLASDPDQRSTALNDLGIALGTLGEREPGTERPEAAVAAYRAALMERTRDRVPLNWAMTQMNLGTALTTLGEREPGTERLEAAVAAYCAALTEWTRDRVPLDWARTQMNLGTALQSLGEREPGTKRLEEAVAAYRAALTEWTRDRVPLDWANTRGNMGTALIPLAERRGDVNQAREALALLVDAEGVLREGGHAVWAKTLAHQIPRAKALIARLSGEEAPDSAPQKE